MTIEYLFQLEQDINSTAWEEFHNAEEAAH